ncbi:MAG: transaldolase [Sulfurospirillaceae bacterium]|jgi:transaldolase|nr:transaldolase [Sulfurospirillaceae bacterium]MCK9545250.1 transaldolase [Sulfurospirillaceae bacterium]MDY0237446.1 transaldolase [Campylobacterales bacterium]NLM98998.1 transaldolase [Campylobacteraceae bacterium]
MYLKDEKFSLWCDFIERDFLKGDFLTLIKDGKINGATSNPAIFKSAFLNSSAYKKDRELLSSKSPKEIYETLAIQDIKEAAKALLPLYKSGDDGFVSIEVDPFLSEDIDGTIKEGLKLAKAIDMPNLMIKIPATNAGFEAMKVLSNEGLNINATLVFSLDQTKKCLEALKDAKKTKSVISVFVSRFDTKLNSILFENSLPKNRVGIMNALMHYKEIEAAKLPNIRALFASTGTKDDSLELSYYIDELLVPNSINTAPIATIKAFMEKDAKPITPASNEALGEFFNSLKESNIDIEKISNELFNEGIDSFNQAFKDILKAF